MSGSQINSLPKTCKGALFYEFGQDLRTESFPTPQPVYGTVVIKIEAAPIYGLWKKALAVKNPLISYPTLFVPGGPAVGRVAAVGPDTTTLQPGQLVLAEYFVQARDDPVGVQFVRGGRVMGDGRANKLAEDLYRHGAMAEYQIVAHENCHPLDEKLFLGSPSDGGLGYKLPQLGWLGLRDIDLKAGETIVILPATGVFGGCAVEVASAMGARVVVGGRNVKALQKLAESMPNIKTVQLTGDVEADTAAITKYYGPVDAYADISSPMMPDAKHISAGLGSLATYGRASIRGGLRFDIPISYSLCVLKSLTLKGRFMYEREHVQSLIKLAATGALELDRIEVAEFKLEDWKEALDVAWDTHGWGKLVTIAP